jgi:hypothetical protein
MFAAKMLPNSLPAGHRADRVDQPDSFTPGTRQLSVKRGHLGRETDARKWWSSVTGFLPRQVEPLQNEAFEPVLRP